MPKRKALTPKQKKLVKLLPKVAAGDMTMKAAMLKAGYAESSANEQSETLGSLGNQRRMQEALRNAGMTEEYIAKEIVKDTKKLSPGATRLGYLKASTELLDVIPSKKIDGKMNVTGRIKLGDIVDAADDEDDENNGED